MGSARKNLFWFFENIYQVFVFNPLTLFSLDAFQSRASERKRFRLHIYISLGQIDGSGTHSVFFLGSKIENSHLNITRFKPCYMWLLFFFYCDTIVVVWGFKETERKTFPTTARTFGWFFDQRVRLFLLIFLMIFSFVVDKKIPLWSVHVARDWITSCTTMNSNVHACLKSIQLKSANNYQPRLQMRINFTLVFRK